MPVALRRLRRPCLLAWLVPLALAGPAAGDEPAVLTTIRAVAEAFRQAGPRPTVDLEAVVTGGDALDARSIWLRDDTGATFAIPGDRDVAVAVGDRVRVRGGVFTGVYIDGIADATFERLGTGPAPEPRRVGPTDLAAGTAYHDLVTASGVVRSIREFPHMGSVLTLNVPGGTIEVRCDWRLTPEEAVRLIDAEVRATGFGGGEASAARQLLRPFLRVVTRDGLTITAPAAADPFAGEAVSLDSVGRGPRPDHRVVVAGVATSRGGTGGGVFLAAGDAGLFVEPAVLDAAVRAIAPGDRVEAAGFATIGPVVPFLGDAVLRVSGTGPVPAARRLPDVQTGGLPMEPYLEIHRQMWQNALPIEVEVDVASRIDRDGTVELVGTTPVRQFAVRGYVPGPAPDVVPGSRLRLRGACRVTATERCTFRPMPTAFDVWANSAADATVLRAAPWWTRPRVVRALAATLAACLVAAAAASAWAVLLQRQVRSRTRQLAAEIRSRRDAALEFEATLRERNRLAANLHDTLLQTLGGIGYQLDACEGSRGRDDSEARLHFDVARRMVSHASSELHNAVWAMRSLPIRDQSFPDALRSLADRVGEGHAARITVETAGDLAAVPEFVAGNVLLIVQEAVLNALRHGRAARIDVRVADRPAQGAIEVEVKDDGRGFDPGDRLGIEQGHFGIQGMRERVERLGGSLAIESLPGRGATVRARVLRREFDAELAAEPAS